MPQTICGTVVRGSGVASKNIKFQLPHLVWQFPDIKEVFPASINVKLDTPLHHLKYDYTTLPTPWWDVDERGPGHWAVERFSFLRIGFEYPIDGSTHQAWIFGCHNSEWFPNPSIFEIITHKLDGLVYGARCKICVPD